MVFTHPGGARGHRCCCCCCCCFSGMPGLHFQCAPQWHSSQVRQPPQERSWMLPCILHGCNVAVTYYKYIYHSSPLLGEHVNQLACLANNYHKYPKRKHKYTPLLPQQLITKLFSKYHVFPWPFQCHPSPLLWHP